MQNMRKGVQVYTVREFIGTQEGYEQSLRKIREIGYDSVQTYGWKVPDAEHKAFLEELGLTTESVGGDYEEMLRDPAAIKKAIETAHFYGTDLVSVGTLPVPLRESREGFLEYAAGVNKIGAELKKEGVHLLYHSHALEFFSLGGGENGFDLLFNETDPEAFWYCIDTHWMQSGGKNPAEYILKAKGRVPIVHFKDYKIVGGATRSSRSARRSAKSARAISTGRRSSKPAAPPRCAPASSSRTSARAIRSTASRRATTTW